MGIVKMNNKLNEDTNQILNDYKSVNQMLKGNISILKTLQFDKIPELSRAFCLGVVERSDMQPMQAARVRVTHTRSGTQSPKGI